jgi:hypothetical protein
MCWKSASPRWKEASRRWPSAPAWWRRRSGDHQGVDRVGLGALAEGIGKGADLGGVDPTSTGSPAAARLATTTL